MDKPNYIKELDGLRAVAIVLVLLWHYFLVQTNSTMLPNNLWQGLSWTWSGVDLFFILSGFLIGRILMSYKDSPNYFKTFYLRRVFRIFPLYYLILITYVLLVEFGFASKFDLLLNSQIPQYSYFLYLQNFYIDTRGFGSSWLSATWSLAVEEQFYLIFPLLIYYVPYKQLPKWFIIGILLAPICRGLIWGFGSYVLLPARMDTLLLGALIAYYYRSGVLQETLAPYRKYLYWVLAMVFGVFLAGLYREGANHVGGIFNHSLLVIFYGLIFVIVLLNNNARTKSILNNSIMVYIGKISYGIYLFHQIVLYLLVPLIQGYSYPWLGDMQSVWVTVLSLVVTIALASATYFLIEKPLIKVGKKYSY